METLKTENLPTDSVYIFELCESCVKKQKKYGIARQEDENVIIF